MWKKLLFKWFGLEDTPCMTCEVLRERLAYSEAERKDLLRRLLDKGSSEPPPLQQTEEMKPITPQFVPWRMKQQMLEAEDRKRAQLMKQKADEIDALEKELGVTTDASQ